MPLAAVVKSRCRRLTGKPNLYGTVFPLLVLLASCSRGESVRKAPERVVTISAAQYAAANRLTLELVAPICPRTSGELCALQDVGGAAASEAGAALFATGGAIQLYDTTGRLVRQIGAVGLDPASYVNPAAVVFDRGGRLHVYDMGSLRVLSFDTSGALRSQSRVPVPFGLRNLQGLPRLGPNGLLYFLVPGGPKVGAPVEGTFVRADTGAPRTRRQAVVVTRAVYVADKDLQPMSPFFMARATWTVSPDGSIVFTNGDSAIISRLDTAGRMNLRIDVRASRSSVTARDIELETKRVLGLFSSDEWRARGRPYVERAAKAALPVHPAVTDLRVLDDGSIWLRGAVRSDADSARWEVLSKDGAFIGSVWMDRHSTIMGGRLSRFVVVSQHKGASPNVAWFRVTTSTPTGKGQPGS